jgi:Protein of unknown function (DUF2637)
VDHGTSWLRWQADNARDWAADAADQVGRAGPVVRAGLARVVLAVLVAAPTAASWHNVVGWARDSLGLSGGWEYVPPLTLEGAAFYCALLGLRAVLAGESAIGPRLLVLLYAGGAAWVNVVYAAHTGGVGPAVYFGAASLSAVLLWDLTLRQWRRRQLREIGAVEPPLPRYRPLRWIVRPRETAEAWALAIGEGITDPTAALARARMRRAGIPAPAPLPELAAPLPELASLSKADALRTAWAALGVEVPEQSDAVRAVAWLLERGVTVNESYAYNVARKDAEAAAASRRAELQVAGGESR